MAIFGNSSVPGHTGNVLGTTTDVYLNYIFGILILIPFIISTLLNPVVFIYKYNQPRSVASILYMMLSASDFLTTLFRPILLSYEFLKPGLDDYVQLCTTSRQVRFSFLIFQELSCTVTTFLAVMRFIAIQFPFYRPRKKILFGTILAWSLICFMPVMCFTSWVCGHQGRNALTENVVFWLRPQQVLVPKDPQSIIFKTQIIRYMFTTAVALIASVATVVAMLRNKSTPNTRSRDRGCVTIVVMNTASIISLFIMMKDGIPLIFGTDAQTQLPALTTTYNMLLFLLVNIPLLLSAFNPLVIVLFSSQIKGFIRAQLGLARVQTNKTEVVELSVIASGSTPA